MDLIQKIKEVVKTFMTNGSSFSAHDVTVELRAQNERVYHNQVRDMIHAEVVSQMATFNYEKTFTKTNDGTSYQVYQPSAVLVNVAVPLAVITKSANIDFDDFDGRDLNFEEDSSWVVGAKWNPLTAELYVSTKAGKSYIYQGVDAATVLDWEVADSVGTFFNENIKANFSYVHAN